MLSNPRVVAALGLIVGALVLVLTPLTAAYDLATEHENPLGLPARAVAFALSLLIVAAAYRSYRKEKRGEPSSYEIVRLWGRHFRALVTTGTLGAAAFFGFSVYHDLQHEGDRARETCRDVLPDGASAEACLPMARACLKEERRLERPNAAGARVMLSYQWVVDCVKKSAPGAGLPLRKEP
jgi:hypothetical protein